MPNSRKIQNSTGNYKMTNAYLCFGGEVPMRTKCNCSRDENTKVSRESWA